MGSWGCIDGSQVGCEKMRTLLPEVYNPCQQCCCRTTAVVCKAQCNGRCWVWPPSCTPSEASTLSVSVWTSGWLESLTWSSAVSGWWFERCQCLLIWGCRASPPSMDSFMVTPLPLMLLMRCVIKCIFGHENEILVSPWKSSSVHNSWIPFSLDQQISPYHVPESEHQVFWCGVAAMQVYLMSGPRNEPTGGYTQVPAGWVSQSHPCPHHEYR